jgi:hypothetical protein
MPFMPAPPSDAKDAARRTVMFGSLESGPGQRFAGSGLKHAPLGALGESGVRIIARGGASQWQDRRKDFAADAKSEGALLIGVDQMTGRGAIGLYVGPEITTLERPSSMRRAGVARGQPQIVTSSTLTEGLRIEASLWDHPTQDTLLTLNAAMGSARREGWGRAAFGQRIGPPASPVLMGQPLFGPSFFIGPEAELSLAGDYTKWRVGAHVTQFRLMGFTLRLAAGHERASGTMRGLYVTAGLHWFR